MPYEQSGLALKPLELVGDLLEGPSFEDVCKAHRVRVRGLCRKLLRSDADAEDAVQEAMLRAYKAWPQFRVGENPWPWLATIAANVCHDAGRRESRAAVYVATIDHEEQVSPDCYDVAARNTRCELVQEALASLPPAYGTPLYLRDIEGWSIPDVARLQGRSVASVRSSLSRSRKVLATRIEALARAKHQWPLPVAAPLIARLRLRVARIKAAVDGAALNGLTQLDSALSALASVRLGAFLQVATAFVAAVAAAAAVGIAADGRPSSASASIPPSPPPLVATTSPAASAIDGTPRTEPPPADDRGAGGGGGAPGIASVAISDAQVVEGDRTATPTATVTPATPPVDGENGVVVFVGPVGFDCSSQDPQSDEWRAICGALRPIPARR